MEGTTIYPNQVQVDFFAESYLFFFLFFFFSPHNCYAKRVPPEQRVKREPSWRENELHPLANISGGSIPPRS